MSFGVAFPDVPGEEVRASIRPVAIAEHPTFQSIPVKSTKKVDVLAALSAAGISLEPNKIEPTREMAVALVAKIFHLPLHQYHLVDRLVNRIEQHEKGKPSQVASKRQTYLSGKGIIQHLRFEDGIAFPEKITTAPQLLNEDQLRVIGDIVGRVAGAAPVKQSTKLQHDRVSDELIRLSSAPQLPACNEHKTIRISKPKRTARSAFDDVYEALQLKTKKTDRNQKQGLTSAVVEYDVLFLRKNAPRVTDLLVGIEELFGGQTQVKYYSQEVGDQYSLLAAEGNVACLPFRLRVTDKYIYREYGKNALKQYGDKPNGKGRYHPLITKMMRELL